MHWNPPRGVAQMVAAAWLLLLAALYGVTGVNTLLRDGFLGAWPARGIVLASVLIALTGLGVGLGRWSWLRRSYLAALATMCVLAMLGVLIGGGSGLGVGVVAWLTLLGWALGDCLIRRLFGSGSGPHGWLRPVFALALAWGVASHAMLGLALVGQVHPVPVIVALAALSIAFRGVLLREVRVLGRLVRTAHRRSPSDAWFVLPCVGLLAWLLLVQLVETVAPEIQYDALNYHLSVVRLYIDEGRFVLTPQVLQSYFYLGTEMDFLLAMLLGGQIAAKCVHFAFFTLDVLAIFGFARQLSSQRAAAFGAVLFVATPLILWEAATTYIDLALTLYCTLAVVAVCAWLRDHANGWLLTAGALAGFAISAKIGAGLLLAPLTALLGVAFLVQVQVGWRTRLLQVLAFVVPALVCGAPWPALRYSQTGNPVFPFLNGVFKSPLWPAVNETMNFNLFGIGTGPASLLRLPWAMTFNSDRFIEAVPEAVIGVSILVLPTLVVVRPIRVWVLLVGSVLLGFGLLWAFAVQYLRYFLPGLPLACLLAGEALARLSAPPAWGALARVGPLTPRFVVLVTLTAAVPLSAGMYWNIPERIPFRVGLGFESREAYLRRTVATYEGFEQIASAAGSLAHTLALGDARWLYAPGLVETESSASVEPVLALSDPADIGHFLRERGFTHVLVYRGGLDSAHESLRVASPEFLSESTQLIWAARDVLVYRVLTALEAAARPSGPPPNLLMNGGFEEFDGRGPIGWASYGQPVLDTTGGHSRRGGKVAALVSPASGFFQSLPISAGRLYTFSHYSRSDQPGSSARVQLNWLDSTGNIIDTSIDIVPANIEWAHHEITVMAPAGAATTVAYANAQSGEVWVDDVNLVAAR